MSSIWLPLCLLIYAAIVLLWARQSAVQNAQDGGFFSAAHTLTPWIAAVVIAGVSLPGWFLLGGAAYIAQNGLQAPAFLVAGVVIALPGCLFFKRLWLAAMRLRVSSLAGLFGAYYKSPFLVVVTVVVAFLFAIGFTGLQLRASAHLLSFLADGAVSPLMISVVMGFLIFAGIGIGGLRSAAYLGVLQTLFVISAIIVLSGLVLFELGGFAALNTKLKTLADSEAGTGLFLVRKVIQFTGGLGRGTDPALANTAMANFGFAFALMGLQCGPIAVKLVMSARNVNGVAAGQTWLISGVFGFLFVFAIAVLGLAGLLDDRFSLQGLLALLQSQSPWFAGWVVVGLIAGVQVMAGLSIFVASESLIRNVYKPYFHANLSKQATLLLVRVTIAVVVLISVIMQTLTPITLSALAAISLPMSLQLVSPILGVTWARWITRPAAACGVGFGLAAVLLTEPLGHEILSAFGLDLPWGRWPWTLHSAVWGAAANLMAVLIIAAITNRDDLTEAARATHTFFAETQPPNASVRALRPTAWSLLLAWMFLAVGPGLIFGNHAFAPEVDRQIVWLFNVPSLWAWSFGAWFTGLGLVWFLSYKMQLASPVTLPIAAHTPTRHITKDTSNQEKERLRQGVIALSIIAALIIFVTFTFGR